MGFTCAIADPKGRSAMPELEKDIIEHLSKDGYELPESKILFPALWRYSKLSKTIPRKRVAKANCVNNSEDPDAHVFDCTTNCYLCHFQNGEAIYEIRTLNNDDDDGEEEDEIYPGVEIPVVEDNDDTFESTSHSEAPPVHHCSDHAEHWEECMRCARDRLRAEGWHPRHFSEEETDVSKEDEKMMEVDEPIVKQDTSTDESSEDRRERTQSNVFGTFFVPPPLKYERKMKLESTTMYSPLPKIFFHPANTSDTKNNPAVSQIAAQPRIIVPLPTRSPGKNITNKAL
ncbi:hypothetical protein EV361DRAFT_955921 [Lentinula raphanica]|nr:hypothetical protein EV361DRAFT_955921 [Lentinula raphanica]